MSCNILDIPDEILVKIISHFNPRERLALADSCSRFKSLVFRDEELMRDLNFSRKGRMTRIEDIQRYFRDAKSRDMVRAINIQNVNCMKAGNMLNDSIGKALNLVELNIHGIKFSDIKQLGNFLEPLIHLKRLSIDWPKSYKEDNVRICRKVLQKSLSKLSFFSVEVYMYSVEFLPIVKLCEELEELHIVTTQSRPYMRRMSWDLEPKKLKNLRIVQVRGWQAMQMKKHLVSILPDLEEWTDFQLTDVSREPGFYLEKNVEVCEELKETKLIEGIPYQRENPTYDMGWSLISEYLLKEVIKITHEDVPETFCSLIPTLAPLEEDREPCLLRIDEAKRLLKNPRHQISFLYFKHSIETDCDAHLIASAFPNLTELVLCDLIKSEDIISAREKRKHLKRRLRRRGGTMPEEEDDLANSDSSFEMLVENTPNLRDLTIYAQNDWSERPGEWDISALNFIPRWRNLSTLRLAFLPIRDGKFLIDIGRECPGLERIVLHYLGITTSNFCYGEDLSEMLKHCKNLKEFSIRESYIKDIAQILRSLSNNSKLRRLRLISSDKRIRSCKLGELVSSVEELLHRCEKLNTLVFIINGLLPEYSKELTTAFQRIHVELNRPDLQFQTSGGRAFRNVPKLAKSKSGVREDAAPSFFPTKLEGFDFR